MSVWLDSSGNSNKFKQSYFRDFVDVSGEVLIRNGLSLKLYNSNVPTRVQFSINSNEFRIYNDTDHTYYDISNTKLLYLQDLSENVQAKLNQVNAVQSALNLKASTSSVDASFASVASAIATKASTSVVDASFASVSSAIDSKASTTIVDASFALVDSEIATKASTSVVDASFASVSSAIALKAGLASPALTGVPTAPTATAGTNTTQIATTAFVKTAVDNLVANAPAALDTLNELAAALGSDASFSTTITNSLASKAPLANPTFTGTVNASKVVISSDASFNGRVDICGNFYAKYPASSIPSSAIIGGVPTNSVDISSNQTISGVKTFTNGLNVGNTLVNSILGPDPNFQRVQIGLDINGEATNDSSGYSVSMNSDGTIVAIGAPYNDGTASNGGHVRVYKNINGTWTKLGQDIDSAVNNYSYFGQSVSLSDDGTILAIGAPGYNSSRGAVYMYKYNGTTWTQLGQSIYGGISVSDQFGFSVSLNSDGTTVAIGGPYYDYGSSNTGFVSVYKYVGTTWTQLGGNIWGEAGNDQSGYSVSLSSDGLTLAIGANLNDGTLGGDRGHVRVYNYNGTAWTKLGQDIDGEAGGDFSGWSVSLSSNGQIVAIGGPYNDGTGDAAGHVRVYQYNGTTTWTQLGSDINGEAALDFFGTSVSLSSDGTILAVGAYNNDGNGSNSGHVRIYQYSNSTWTQLGSDIDGKVADDQSGWHISLSKDGAFVAIGAPNIITGAIAGYVRVYKIRDTTSTKLTINNNVDICGNLYAQYAAASIPASAINGISTTIQTALNLKATQSIVDASFTSVNSAIALKATTTIVDASFTSVNSAIALKATKTIVDASFTSVNSAIDLKATKTIVDASFTSVNSAIALKANLASPALTGVPTAPTATAGTNTTQLATTAFVKSAVDSLVASAPAALDTLNELAAALGNDAAFSTTVTNSIASKAPLANPTFTGTVTASKVTISSDASFSGRVDVCGNFYANYPDSSIPQSAIVGGISSAAIVDLTSSQTISGVKTFSTQLNIGTNTLTPLAILAVSQMGSNLLGRTVVVQAGASVALNDDGTIIAIGCPNDYMYGMYSGSVRVYQWSGSAWSQLGADIMGTRENNTLGYSVSLSSTGLILAIGGPNISTTRVYQYVSNSWSQLGADIVGTGGAGNSVSISSDGMTVAIGAPQANSSSGQTRVYKYISSTWTQLGQDIASEAAGDWSGISVALSADGTTVVIGANYNRGAPGDMSGHARVYKYATGTWTQIGQDLDGEYSYDMSGWSVAISDDGTIVAIGAPRNTTGATTYNGQVRVYKYANSTWTQVGQDIDGRAIWAQSGTTVSLSSDGYTVAIGADSATGLGGEANRGYATLYKYDGTIWKQLGTYLEGQAGGDKFGTSVALSADGTTLAAGAPFANSNDGYVKVYKIQNASSKIIVSNGFDICGNLYAQYPANSIPVTAISANLATLSYVDSSLNAKASLAAPTFTGTVVSSGDLALNSKLRVSGDASFNGRVDICGNFYAKYPASSIPVSAIAANLATVAAVDTSLNLKASIAAPTFTGTVVSSGDLSLNSKLRVSGDASFNGRVDICGNFYAKYPASSIPASAIVGVSDTLSVTNINISGNVGIGTTTPQAPLQVVGNSKIGSLSLTTISAQTGLVYDSSWSQVGNTIQGRWLDLSGTLYASYAGWITSINGDGTIVAHGTDTNYVNIYKYRTITLSEWNLVSTNSRTVPVAKFPDTVYDSTKKYWVQMGNSIVDFVGIDDHYTAVSLNDAGDTIVIGGSWDDTGGTNMGICKVFKYDSVADAWNQVGQNIYGSVANEYFGTSVDINAAGNIIAAGGQLFNSYAGRAVVYRYDSAANQWNQIGQTFTGGKVGASLSLSSDGYTIAIAHADTMIARIYTYSSGTNLFVQNGGDIVSEVANDRNASSVSLSADGTMVAVGASWATSQVGQVRVYEYRLVTAEEWAEVSSTLRSGVVVKNGDTTRNATKNYWVQIGNDVNGATGTTARTGIGVSLRKHSVHGTTLAVQGTNNVKLYKYRQITQSEWNATTTATYSSGVMKGNDTVYSSTKSYWIQLGYDSLPISSNAPSVACDLNSDGTVLVFGSPNSPNNLNQNVAGLVYVYKTPFVATNFQNDSIIDTLDNNARRNLVLNNTLSIDPSGVTTIAGRIDICGNLYAKYPDASIPASAINGVSSNVQTALNLKANTSAVDASLNLKSNLTYVDASLNLKSNLTYVDASLNLKSDLTYVDASLNLKANLVSPTFTGPFVVASGDVSMNNNLRLGGDLIVKGNLSVFRQENNSIINTTINNYEIIITKDISLNGNLAIANNASLNSKLFVVDDVSLNNKLFVNGNATLNSKLSVANDASFNGRVDICGNLYAQYPNSSIPASAITDGVTLSYVDASLNLKSDVTYVDASLNLKSNLTYVDNALNLKSNLTYVDSSLNLKSDLTYVDNALNLKSDRTYVDSSLNLKSDITYVDASLNVKPSFSQVDASLNLKSDITYVDNALNLKSNITYVDTSLNLKSNLTYVDTALNLKANLASPTFTGIPNAPTASYDNSSNQVATTGFVQGRISSIINSAPAALDTLNELAAALGNDANYAATVTNSLSQKANITDVNSALALKSNLTYVDASLNLKSDITYVDSALTLKSNLTYVDASLNVKPSFSQVDASLNLKSNLTYVDASLNLKSNLTYVDASLNLKSNLAYVDTSLNLKANTTDVNSALALKATIASVDASLNLKSNLTYVDASLNLKSNLTYVDASLNVKPSFSQVDASLNLKSNLTYVDASLNLKSDITYVDTALNLKANLASPTFTGIPNAPTAAYDNSSNQLATTGFVQGRISAIINSAPAALDTLNELAAALGNDANYAATVTNSLSQKANITDVNSALALKAPIASVDASLNLKSNITYVDASLNLKANATDVNSALALKAPIASVDASLNLKSNLTYVDSSLNLKSNITYVDSSLNMKANTTDVNSALALKATIASVDASLNLKSAVTYVDASLNLKSAVTYVDASLNLKSNLASPTFTGIPNAPTASYDNSSNQIATTGFVQGRISAIINSAPAALDTLNELAAALGNDANYAATVTNSLSQKANITDVNSALALKATITAVDASLNLKANATDVNSALALKATIASVDASLNLKSNLTYVDASLNLKSNATYVDASLNLKANATDVNSALALKAPIASVDASLNLKSNLTYVDASLNLKSNLTYVDASLNVKPSFSQVDASLNLKSNVTYVDASLNLKSAVTYVDTSLNLKANLASPTFTGTPNAPTASYDNSSNQIATTGFVQGRISSIINSAPAALDTLNELAAALGNDANYAATVTNSLSQKANITDVNAALALKASITAVDASLNLKANATDVNSALALKAPIASVDASLNLKSNLTYVDASLNLKSNLTYVDSSLNLKSAVTYVDSSLNLKANTTDVTSALALKATITAVDASLNLKSNINYVDASLNLKSNLTYVDASLNLKANLASPIFTGTPNAPTASYDNSSNQIATTGFVQGRISAIINSAPAALDTLNELAAALGNDANYAATVTNSLSQKANITDVNASLALKATTTIVDASLNLKANATDVNSALALKAPIATVDASLNLKSNLTYVDASLNLKANATDVNSALALKAPIVAVDASLNLKSNLTYVDSSLNLKSNLTYVDSSLNLKANATDVNSALALKAPIVAVDASLNLKSNLTYVDASLNAKPSFLQVDASLNLKSAVTYVDASLNLKATLASPTFTGTPNAPTASYDNSSNQIATTGFVQGRISAIINSAPAALDTLNELAAALGNDANYAATVTNSLSQKANTTDVNSALALKATTTLVDASLNLKSNLTYVDASLNAKPSFSQVDASLNLKSNLTYVDASLNAKPNFSQVDASLNLKSNVTYVDASLNLKSNVAYVDASLNLKSNVAYVDASLNAKPSFSQVDASLNLKSAVTYVDASLNLKANLASPTFTGTPNAPTAAYDNSSNQIATTGFVQGRISAIINSAPAALDTLNELAAALGNDANYAATVTNSLSQKANTTDVNAALALKATITAVDASLNLKSNLTYVDASLNAKPSFSQVDASLNLKSNVTYVDASLNLKSNVTYVDAALTAKPNFSQVDASLNLKSNITYVDASLNAKPNFSQVDASLNLKSAVTYVDASLNAKPSFSQVDASLNLKANLVSPTFTGTPNAPTAAYDNSSNQIATTGFVQGRISAIINSAPAALDTLNELAAALGNDANYAATVTNSLSQKANTTDVTSALALKATITAVDASLNLKSNITYVDAALTAKPNFSQVDASLNLKSAVTYVDASLNAKPNFSQVDASLNLKPSFSQVDASLNLKSNLTYVDASLNLKSNVTYVDASLNLKSNVTYVDAALTAKPNFSQVDASLNLKSAVTYVDASLNLKATLASPTFTGTPNAPTASYDNSSNQIATTGFVQGRISSIINSAPAALDTLNELAAALGNDANYAATVTNSLSQKANATDVTSALALKATIASVDASLNLKSNVTYVDASLNLKSNVTYVDASLNLKSDRTYVDAALTAKPSFSQVDVSLNAKPSFSQVDASLNLKSNITYVDAALTAKPSFSQVDVSLNAKPSFSQVDASLNLKSDRIYVDSSLNTKPSFSQVDSSLNLKANAVSPTFTGVVTAPKLISGDASFNGNIDISGVLSVTQTVNSVVKNTTINNYNVSVTNDLSLNGKLVVSSDVSLNGKLYVKGDASFGRVDICGNFYAQYPNNSIPSSAISNGVTLSYVDASLNLKSAVTYVDASLNLKSDRTYVDAALNAKPNFSQVDASLNSKSNLTYVDASLNLKSSVTYVDAALTAKPSFSQVDASLNLKSNVTYVDASLNLKSSITYVDAALNAKPNFSQVDASLNLKSTVTYVDASLNLKANLVSPTFTGTPNAPTAAYDNSSNQIATTGFVQGRISAIINSAPAALDTLNELAAALGNDANYAATVTNSLSQKANITDVNTALALKPNFSQVDASLNAKPSFSQVDVSLNLKPSFSQIDVSLNLKPSFSQIDASLNAKPSFSQIDVSLNLKSAVTYVDASLNLKPSFSQVDASLILKPSFSQIDASLNLKSAVTYVDASLNLKSAVTYVDASLNLKSAVTYVDASLNLKPSFSQVDASLNLKSAVTYVDASLNLKANLASPTFTGTPNAPTAAYDNSSNQIATTGFVQGRISAIINSAPAALDTLNELAAALGNDANYAATVTNSLSQKANITDVNTSLALKPNFSQVDASLNLKPTFAQVDASLNLKPTFAQVDASLNAIINSSQIDASLNLKPSFSQVDASLNLKSAVTYVDASLNLKPSFSQVDASLNLKSAVTYVDASLNLKPTFAQVDASLNLKAAVTYVDAALTAKPNFSQVDASLNLKSNVTYVDASLNLKANLASPTFTGTPNAPTASYDNSSNQIATTGFVQGRISAIINSAPAALDTLNELAAALGNDANFAATVTNSLSQKANATDVNSALALKPSFSQVDASLNLKPSFSQIDASLNLKPTFAQVDASLNLKAAVTYVDSALTAKPNFSQVDASLNLKSNITYVDASLNLKPSFSQVDASLNLKPSFSQIDASLNLKAAVTYVDSSLSMKPSFSQVDASLNLKAAVTYVDSSLSLKPSFSQVDASLNLKPTFAQVDASLNAILNFSQVDASLNLKPSFSQVDASLNLKSAVTYVDASLNLKAALASPTFTGIPNAPTAAYDNSSNQIATTGFVQGRISSIINSAPAALDTLNELAAALGNDANYAATVTNSLSQKANATDVNAALALKPTFAQVDASLNLKPTFAQVDASLNAILNIASVDASLNLKPSFSQVDASLNLKSNLTYVDASLNLKSNLTYVDASLNLKPRFAQVDVSLNLKPSFSQVDASLNLKPSFSQVDASLNSKASFSQVDASLNLKANVASPIFTGIVTAAKLTSGDASFNGNIDISGVLSVTQTVNSVVKNTTINNYNVSVTNDLSLNGKLVVSSDVSLNSKLYVKDDASFNGRVDICGNFYANYPANSIPSSAIIGGVSSGSTSGVDISSNQTISGVKTFTNGLNVGSILVSSVGTVGAFDPSFQRIQIGQDIDGEATSDQSGWSISINSDGTVVAIGAVINAGNGSQSGQVRVYKNINGTWTKLGQDLDGEATTDQYGWSVSLSADGTIVAIGSQRNDGTTGTSTDNRGHVRVYKYNGSTTWTQLGQDIDGETAGDFSGTSVSLSSDGTIVAIGATRNSGNGYMSGQVRVYKYNGSTTWTKLGQDIDGEAANDSSGLSVSLSSDGTIVAIGATGNAGTASYAGHVRVYKYNGSTTWTQLGQDIDGEAASDNYGQSVSLSSDGTIVAIGAAYNDGTTGLSTDNRGHVRVFKYNGSTTWTQLGQDIDGEAASDQSGYSVSLSSDGTIVAIGAPYNSPSGHVRIYQYNGSTTWAKLGSDIDGEATGDKSGWSVSLSSDSKFVAIGGWGNDSYRGHARVYKIRDTYAASKLTINNAVDICGNLYAQYAAASIPASAINGISSAIQTAIDLKATKTIVDASFTSVTSAIALKADLASPTFTGNVVASKMRVTSDASFNGRVDICGNFYAQYPASSIPSSAIIGGVGGGGSSSFATDICVNSITIGRGGGNSNFSNAVGINALGRNTTGGMNVAVGTNSLFSNLIGSQNVAMNFGALYSNTSGSDNIAIGKQAINANQTGSNNVGIGTNAIKDITSSNNTAVGYQSLVYSSTGSSNTAFGYLAGQNNSTGSFNTYIGYGADLPAFGATWSNSTAIGANAMITASNQITLGTAAERVFMPGKLTTTGDASFNGRVDICGNFYAKYPASSIPSSAIIGGVGGGGGGSSATDISINSLTVGRGSGNNLNNTAFGVNALFAQGVDVNSNSTAIGYYALSANQAGNAVNNTAVGSEALKNNTTGNFNTALGSAALRNNTTGGSNTALGAVSLAANTTGNSNVAINGGLGVNTTGSDNIAIGKQSLTASQTGNNNIAIGTLTIQGITSSSNNTAVGHRALVYSSTGSSNTAYGYLAGQNNSTGSFNTYIGYGADLPAFGATWSNSTAIGANAMITASNQITLGTAAERVFIPGKLSTSGDASFNGRLDIGTNSVTPLATLAVAQIGTNLLGRATARFVGASTALNDAGTIVAIGCPSDGNFIGSVRIYQWSGTAWTQLGQDIVGTADNTQLGNAVSLSSTGFTIAIGGFQRNLVRVYQYASNVWTQVGTDIVGTGGAGSSVSISADGLTVAIGAPNAYINGGQDTGQTRVYKYISSAWTQLGQDLIGEAASNRSGFSLALSADGTIVVIGAHYNDGTNSNGTIRYMSGHARIYKYANSTWTQLGQDIDGEVSYDMSGWSVDISDDGTIVAIGAPRNTTGATTYNGHARIYKYANSTWTQLGQDIDGRAIWNESGSKISLSADGYTVAIGAAYAVGLGGEASRGYAVVYKYNGTTWSMVGSYIEGQAAQDQFGYSMSLSADGTILSVGAPYNNSSTGYVKVYKVQTPSSKIIVSDGLDICGNLFANKLQLTSNATFNGRVDICGNFYAQYPPNSIPASAIIGGVGSSVSSSGSSGSSTGANVTFTDSFALIKEAVVVDPASTLLRQF